MCSSRVILKKSATVYRRKQALYIHPQSLTTDGVWIVTEPVLKLNETASDADIGSAVRASLDRSHTNVPHPTNWGEITKILLRGIGVRSWSTFVQGASCVIIESAGEELSVMPTENQGARGGFAHQPENTVTLRQVDASESYLGAVVRKLLR